MGQWTFVVTGHGPHHNGKKDLDANEKFKTVVEELKAQGHAINQAHFITGVSEDENGKYLP